MTREAGRSGSSAKGRGRAGTTPQMPRATWPLPAPPGLAEPKTEASAPGAARTGPRIYNLFPLLVGTVSAWTADLPRIARLGFDWVYVNPFHAAGGSRSLYAIRDPDRLDDRFRDPDGGTDDEQVAAFAAAAEKLGLKVMTDLVVNHAARDSLLADERPDLFVHDAAGDIESPSATDPENPAKKTIWGDLAAFDYADPEAREFLAGYWGDYIARMQRLGVKGFRCDAAYKVPPEVWSALIDPARRRDPSCLFAAETLGCTPEEAKATAGAGFDYLFNSFAWWDGHASWALESYEALRNAAPSIAFPENHDMPRLAAGHAAEHRDAVAATLKARYTLAAFFSAGVLMPIGYEWGYRRPLHVVETTPADREATAIDISDHIAAINRLRAGIGAANVEGAQWRLSAPDSAVLALLRFDAGHPGAAQEALLVLANPGPSDAVVEPGPLLAGAGGLLGAFQDRTPGQTPLAFEAGHPLTLAAGTVRIFTAARAPATQAKPNDAPAGERRVVIEGVLPEIDGGRTPIKRVVGDSVTVSADIFSDGHDKIAAEILYREDGEEHWQRAPMAFVDNDRWSGRFPLARNTRTLYTIEAWRDPFASWMNEIVKKRAAGQDVRLETIEGVHILEKAAATPSPETPAIAALLVEVRAAEQGSAAQLDLLLEEANAALIGRRAERVNLCRYDRELVVIADRLAAQFSAWYELFPRSQARDGVRHGTFDDVIARLPYVKAMGFDVLYFPPIHPIGERNRKGRNNSLTAEPGDVGSVYAIGSAAGGHDALHPELGTFADFRRLVAAAHAHGLELALDFAVQCSPDHPWIRQHPEWFEYRPDGTMKYAENPPKKYEDIYNVQFYGASLPSLWTTLRDVVLLWCREGVRIFRADNPHTKPLPFWEWMIGEVNAAYPDALFLAEAFTRPKMMRKLAKIGFQQSYTYFTWRNTKSELTEYMTELAHSEMGEYYRPNFFANTPDINPVPLQTSGPPGFLARATLAATLSSAYGIYQGFELAEGAPIPGKEEYLDSEKYQLRAWDDDRPGNIRADIARLNLIRRDNPALRDFRNITFTQAWNDQILAYAKMTPARDNLIFILVNLDPKNRQDCTYEVPLWLLGLPDDGAVDVEDLLGGYTFTLRGKTHRIALDPEDRQAVIWRLRPRGA